MPISLIEVQPVRVPGPARPANVSLDRSDRLCDEFTTEGSMSLTGDSTEEQAQVDDVFIRGVNFRCTEQLRPGDFRFLKVGQGMPRLASRVRIISCSPRARGGFQVQAEFF
jgi:hypothetical protein